MNMTQRPTVALYVTGHGYGHAVRCAEVARELLQRGARVLVRTNAPLWLFPPGVVPLLPGEAAIDIGVVQRDGLEMDINATRAAWAEFLARWETHVARERTALIASGAHVVLGDIPPLAFAAADAAGIPSLGMTNFGWDWIYEPWDGFSPIVERIRKSYALAEQLLRLPLHAQETEAFPAFPQIMDVPLVVRRPRRSRQAVRAQLNLGREEKLILLSFGGFDTMLLDLQALGHWPEFTFLLTPAPGDRLASVPRNVRPLSREQTDYASLVAACDAVVTKPGYGIVADCLTARVPVLYTERGPFREYPVLVAALHSLGPAHFIPLEDLRRGWLGPPLRSLLDDSQPWLPLRQDGATVVADTLLREHNAVAS